MAPASARPGTCSPGWISPTDVPPPAQNIVGNLLKWEELDSFRTPSDNFFTVKHYELPTIDGGQWRLGIDGLVNHPMSVSLADLKHRARRTVDFTLECSGNTGLPFAIGAIGNARWAGAPLAPLLREAGLKKDATEVVFWGTDSGTVTIRDDSGITGGGTTGTVADDGSGGLDLTITEQFARSMSVADAMSEENLLCYEMNGGPLPPEHGFPVRLIAPGWYGVANVKWLDRIEVRDQRFTGRFMARDYVSIREEVLPNGDVNWTFSNVGPRSAEVGAGQGRPPRRHAHGRRRRLGRADRGGAGPDRRRAVEGRRADRSEAERPGPHLEVLEVRVGHAAGRRAPGVVTRHRRRGQPPARRRRPVPRREAHLLGEQRPDHPAGPDRVRPGRGGG